MRVQVRRYLAYLRYVLRHKLEVAKAGFEVGVPLHQLVLHDWSKLTPSEFLAYARSFYCADGSKRVGKPTEAFDRAWSRHQKIQPHHWQYWCLVYDNGRMKALEMPERFAREMVADWIGAGIVITGHNEARAWYQLNKEKMVLHTSTRVLVEQLLEVHG